MQWLEIECVVFSLIVSDGRCASFFFFTIFLDIFCFCILQKVLCFVNICNFRTTETAKTVLYFNYLGLSRLSYFSLFLFY